MGGYVDYVANGLALVPIPSGLKGPTSKGWNLRENVITDVHEAVSLTGNVGIAHAYCSPPTMALDIDDLPQAKVWLAERGVDLNGLLAADDAVQIASGRLGRAKLLYRLRQGQVPIRTKQIAGADGEMILEFRCASANGLTAQDVLPPSIHPDTGKPYQWAGSGSWFNIPEIPEALLSVWPRQLENSVSPPSFLRLATNDSSMVTLPPETIQHLRSALLSMKADDYDLWINCGMALKPLGDVGRGLWLEWSLTSSKSQDD